MDSDSVQIVHCARGISTVTVPVTSDSESTRSGQLQAQPIRVSDRFAEPVLCRFTPRSACVLTQRSTIPQGTRGAGGYCHPAAAANLRPGRGGQCASRTEAHWHGSRHSPRGTPRPPGPPGCALSRSQALQPTVTVTATAASEPCLAVSRPARALQSSHFKFSPEIVVGVRVPWNISRGPPCSTGRHAAA